ncbi:hypothetical protein FA95DRAFT_1613060 [Auriscalpium vulgare]|uniref:Uncharacterized protein n=1 Tax=Auriscalpium vulgare TaxID=40419 RepID=A0ACB8R409_9AGAM|nr:hypothetical protein FA95DRAFT_1613060 [Auriscalpium vulgare]
MPNVEKEFWLHATEQRLAEIKKSIKAELYMSTALTTTFSPGYERMSQLQDALLKLQAREERAMKRACEAIRKHLQKERRELRARIDAARYNSSRPVSRLPPEIFTHIFAYRAELDISDRPVPLNNSWIAVTHVCQHWRNIAVGCPSLWTNVTAQFGVSWFETMIARSNKMPLSVSVLPGSDTKHQLLRKPLLDNLPQIRQLSFSSLCDSPDQLEFYADLFRRHAPDLKHLSVRALAGIPWTFVFMRNLATLTIDFNDDWTTELPGIAAEPDESEMTTTMEVVTVLQQLQNLTQLTLCGVFFNHSDAHRDLPNTQAKLSSLKHLFLRTTVEAASILLQHIRIPSTSKAVFELYYTEEDAGDIAKLFRDIHSVLSLPTQDGTAGPLIHKLQISPHESETEDALEIRAGVENAPSSQLTISLSTRTSTFTPWHESIWRELQVPWAAVSAFASERLQDLAMCDWLVRGGPGWIAVMEKAPNLRRLHASSFSASALCVALATPARVVAGRDDRSDFAGQKLPLPKLAELAPLWRFRKARHHQSAIARLPLVVESAWAALVGAIAGYSERGWTFNVFEIEIGAPYIVESLEPDVWWAEDFGVVHITVEDLAGIGVPKLRHRENQGLVYEDEPLSTGCCDEQQLQCFVGTGYGGCILGFHTTSFHPDVLVVEVPTKSGSSEFVIRTTWSAKCPADVTVHEPYKRPSARATMRIAQPTNAVEAASALGDISLVMEAQINMRVEMLVLRRAQETTE